MNHHETHSYQAIMVDSLAVQRSPMTVVIDYWLVVSRHPSEKYDFVNWDD